MPHTSHTTMVIVSDHAMADDQWTALEIQPFVYIDCARLVEMLRPLALGMSRERRYTVMAEAIATVIAHEWVHIATQKVGHEKFGVMQPQLEVKDLLAGDERMNPQEPASRSRKKTSGL